MLGAAVLLHGKPRRQPQAARATTCFRESTGAPTKPAEQVTMRFSTHYKTAFGEGLKVVGSLEELGSWEVAAAPAMHWTDGDWWNVDVTLPAGEAFEAKLVHLSGNAVSWEPGRNREVAVPAEGVPLPPGAAVEVACTFAYTDQTALALAGSAAGGAAANAAMAEVHIGAAPPADAPAQESMQAAPEPLLHQLPSSNDAGPEIEPPALMEDMRPPAPEAALAVAAEAPADAPAGSQAKAGAGGNGKALRDMGRAAGLAAAVVAAGVATSALAIDVDLAVAGALVAAGASLLQGGDKKDVKGLAAGGLSAVGKGLDAAESVARAFGLKSLAERRSAAVGASSTPSAGPAAAEALTPADDVAAADARLAACIAEAEAALADKETEAVAAGDDIHWAARFDR
ncbi:hypothetical protein WJX81_004522 [Elliptochloris bilobata]|uniref:CBM20 domain-containing protein n=1 Tax=Elliptochloris bilobata TaxID=381761 RepID=A0AAW1SBJ3_9CHLO